MTFDGVQPVQQKITKHGASKDVSEMLMSVTPVYATKFYISIMQDGAIRITFIDADEQNNLEIVRSAVVMSPNGFNSFLRLMNSTLDMRKEGTKQESKEQ